MRDDDRTLGGPRREWAVSFGLGATLAGCLVTAVVFTVLLVIVLSAAPATTFAESDLDTTPQRLALLIGGITALGLMLVGPLLGLGITWLLRGVRSHWLHVLAFTAVGMLLGAVAGWAIGGPAFANVLAPLVGASTAAGRFAISPFARS